MSKYTWRDMRQTTNLRELGDVCDLTGYAIQSQYSASKKIMALAANFQEHIDPHLDVDLFYEKMFNIYTAQGEGLDNWGRILQISRQIPRINSGQPENPPSPASQLIRLEDSAYRLLLLYKAMANIAASDAATQNSLLSTLMNTGASDFHTASGKEIPAYVLETGTMLIRWVFEAFLDDTQIDVFMAAGTLARGAGVGWEFYAVDYTQVFGFNGSGAQPFGQAPFVPDNALITATTAD